MKIYIVIDFWWTKNLEDDGLFGSPSCNSCLEKSKIKGIFLFKKRAEKLREELSADCPAPPQSRAKVYEIKLF